jgi:hypothetical protein
VVFDKKSGLKPDDAPGLAGFCSLGPGADVSVAKPIIVLWRFESWQTPR